MSRFAHIPIMPNIKLAVHQEIEIQSWNILKKQNPKIIMDPYPNAALSNKIMMIQICTRSDYANKLYVQEVLTHSV